MTAVGEPRSFARRLLWPLLKLTVSVVLMAILFSRIEAGRLWAMARTAAPSWLAAALVLYFLMIIASAWRWGLLLQAQGIVFRFRTLMSSFLVATFFNNFLPSNIGGDVVRIADTAPAAGSKTLATTVVLVDRGIGLLGLVLLAAAGGTTVPRLVNAGGIEAPGLLWGGFILAFVLSASVLLVPQVLPWLLQPVRIVAPQWVDERLGRFAAALVRFSKAPATLLGCFVAAAAVQAVLVGFYLAIARSMAIPIGFSELAVIVPVSFLVQMIPVSVNGFGVREASFGFYFSRLGLPLESALLVSFVGAGMIMLVSISGGILYLLRGQPTDEVPASTALNGSA